LTQEARRTIYLLWRAGVGVRNVVDAYGSGLGVTLTQYTVLSHLSGRDDLTSADLARRLEISPQSVNEMVSALEAAGHLERRPAPPNRKILRLHITPRGREHLARAEAAIDEAEAYLLHAVSSQDRKVLRTVLTQMMERGSAVQRRAGQPDDS